MQPYYDPSLSYEENLQQGPFGIFANNQIFEQLGEPTYDFFGHPIYLPLGIGAGPLPNAKFVRAAFQKGFDLPWYKTVRTRAKAVHPFPNIVPVQTNNDLKIEEAEQGVVSKDTFNQPIAITNSFGVPSFEPDIWQPDMQQAVLSAGKGQVMVASFQGTNYGRGPEAFIEDHVLGARLVKETGAKILEVNLSCPNEGTQQILCFDLPRVEIIVNKIKEAVGNTPLLLKIGYFEEEEFLRQYVQTLGTIADGFSAINTIQAKVFTTTHEQALPGEGRLHSGICGAPIKWAGLDMTRRLNQIRQELGLNYKIIGHGGVVSPEDYLEYMAAGADAVASSTGSIWNPLLAQDIKQKIL